MNAHSTAQAQKSATPASTASHGDVLQRKCACGNHVTGGECEECAQKKGMLQHKPQQSGLSTQDSETVPPIVHEVLRSRGRPLDAETRTFFEPRFGRDFSYVQVHTGTKAAESARAVNALAYTVGRDVVFGAGQYAPKITEGKHLLAHELTHVVQQRNTNIVPTRFGFGSASAEHEANTIAESINDNAIASVPKAIASEAALARQEKTLIPRMEAYAEPEVERIAKSSDLTVSYGSTVDANVKGPFLFLRSPSLKLDGVVALDKVLARNRKFRVGFIQNVILDMGANAEYVNDAGQPYARKTQVYPWPVLDGEATLKPWYGPEAIHEVKNLTGSASMKDQARNVFTLQLDGGKGRVKETWGLTNFQVWFVTQDKQSKEIYFLDWVRWGINWASDISYNDQTPESSVVKPEGKATERSGKGMSGQRPVLTGRVANESSESTKEYH